MQPVATTAGLEIDQRNRQVVAAEEPEESPGRHGLPFGITISAPRDQARRNRGGGFHRLLIESARGLSDFAEAGRTYGAEMSSRRGLPCHQPTQGSQTGIDIARRLRCQACRDQGLWQARVVI